MIVRKFLINHFLLGMPNAAIEKKKDDFVAEAWHGDVSDMGSISCLYHSLSDLGLLLLLNSLDWEVIKARILLPCLFFKCSLRG